MEPFETARLFLRDPRKADLRPLTQLWTDAEVARFMDDYGPRDAIAVNGWLEQIVESAAAGQGSPSSVQLILARKQDSTVVGWVGLGASNRGVAEWDFGYAIHPAHRGNGYASEALAGAVDGCRQSFGIASFWGECDPANVASARVMTSVGFTEIARSGDGNRRFVLGPRKEAPELRCRPASTP